MKNKILIIHFTILLISCSNNNDNPVEINCDKLKSALFNFDSEQLNLEINKLTQDLTPVPTPVDELGHSNNLNELIERLNSNCEDILVTKQSYACIETNPVQSEIKIELDSFGNQIERIIDILTLEDEILISLGMRNN